MLQKPYSLQRLSRLLFPESGINGYNRKSGTPGFGTLNFSSSGLNISLLSKFHTRWHTPLCHVWVVFIPPAPRTVPGTEKTRQIFSVTMHYLYNQKQTIPKATRGEVLGKGIGWNRSKQHSQNQWETSKSKFRSESRYFSIQRVIPKQRWTWQPGVTYWPLLVPIKNAKKALTQKRDKSRRECSGKKVIFTVPCWLSEV